MEHGIDHEALRANSPRLHAGGVPAIHYWRSLTPSNSTPTVMTALWPELVPVEVFGELVQERQDTAPLGVGYPWHEAGQGVGDLEQERPVGQDGQAHAQFRPGGVRVPVGFGDELADGERGVVNVQPSAGSSIRASVRAWRGAGTVIG